jgi:hypothetical protein
MRSLSKIAHTPRRKADDALKIEISSLGYLYFRERYMLSKKAQHVPLRAPFMPRLEQKGKVKAPMSSIGLLSCST